MPAFGRADVLKKLGLELEAEDLFQRKYFAQVKPFPKVRELILKIRENGQRIALGSLGKERRGR